MKKPRDILEELGDLADVIEELTVMYGVQEYKRRKALKHMKRGGFRKGLFLIDVTEVSE
jgi:predicted house-cleaning noncanonical NTP pyrophosphatase (MazG superfamily)